MTPREEAFTLALKAQLARGEAACGVRDGALARDIERYGGAAALGRMLRRRGPSPLLAALAPLGKAALSPEALAVQGAWTDLFTDEEADLCLANLLEAGAFGSR